jgi:drug/metabolite transporter (DMT)-like permease
MSTLTGISDRFRERFGMSVNKRQSTGVIAALSSAVFLGLAPVFGRWAILSGFPALAVVALRTGLATGMLFFIMLLFRRQFLYIFPVGLVGCFLAGAINGLGSLLYYIALKDLPASLGQLLYALYPLFVAVFSVLDKQSLSRLTIFRVSLAVVAVLLLTLNIGGNHIPISAALMMIGSAALYALHIPINQRVLYEIPAPTVTLYTLLAMSLVTIPAYLILDRQLPAASVSWWPVIWLTLVTFISRLTLFLGIKNIGGTQTAILGLGELFITIFLSHYLLNETLTAIQTVGAAILGISIILVTFEKNDPHKWRTKGGWLSWIHPPELVIPWNMQD